MAQRMVMNLVLSLVMLFGTATGAWAKDKIEGLWFNAEQTAKVQIYQAVDGKFWGKIVWLKEPNKDGRPRVDHKNPKEHLRNTPLMNLPILRGFTKKDDKTYTGGEIYDPKSGKTYSCTITYRHDKELGIRGYIGVSMIGKTTSWKRAD